MSSPGALSNPGIELVSPALQVESLLLSYQGSTLLSHSRLVWNLKKCIENPKHSIWANSRQALTADSFFYHPHFPSLSDTPSPSKEYRLPQRQNGLLPWLFKFFPSVLIHLGLNPQNLKDEGKGQRSEPRQRGEDVSKDGPVQETLLAWFTTGERLHVGLWFYGPSDLLPPPPGPHPHPLSLFSSESLTSSTLLFPP